MPVPKPDSFVFLFLSVLQQSEVQYVTRPLLPFSTALNSPAGTSKLKIVMDNTCGCRFTGQFGKLPQGYDHKYVYSHLGYNLKATDMQAAIGCAQLEKLDFIVSRRRENYQTMYDGLKGTPGLLLPEPQKNSKPSWFGFFITVKDDAGYTRNELTSYLEEHQVQTRNLFAGNLLMHPAFEEYVEGKDYHSVGDLPVTTSIMKNCFWLGVYPGMTPEKLQYMIKTIKDFVASKTK